LGTGSIPLFVKGKNDHIMTYSKQLIYIHGLLSDSGGVKATLLRGLFPGIITPDFKGSLEDRMAVLNSTLYDSNGWTMIGSSFGGLMGALFTCQNPDQVDKLVLLAPALIWPDFALSPPDPVDVPVIVYQGARDEHIPAQEVRRLAELVFNNLTFHMVDDDHGLYKTVHSIDWGELIKL
jgi:pimeloyl-ACP methyl ester carboxylesterase